MRAFYPLIFGVFVILLFGLFEILLLRQLNRAWWRHRRIRRIAWSLPIIGTVTVVIWGLGEYNAKDWLSYPGALLTAVVFIFECGLMFSLPVSGALHFLNSLLDRYVRHKHEVEPPVSAHRRLLLKGMAAATPIVTLGIGADGFVRAFSPVHVEIKPFFYPNLPAGLDGLKILHLSDIHLRHYVTLPDLERTVETARPFSPDLVLVTGDISDDLSQLRAALLAIDSLRPPLGCYASLGNHEYFRGIGAVKAIFQRGPIPLLVNQGLRLKIGNDSIYLCAIDDPARLFAAHGEFYSKAVDTTLADHGGEEFILMMSHRPDAFDYAAQKRVDLTLSGHTHGGQIGFYGRSVFERIGNEKYLWGKYQIGSSQLYTSCGAGHWFPFRLGCRAEAPVIELRKGESSANAS